MIPFDPCDVWSWGNGVAAHPVPGMLTTYASEGQRELLGRWVPVKDRATRTVQEVQRAARRDGGGNDD